VTPAISTIRRASMNRRSGRVNGGGDVSDSGLRTAVPAAGVGDSWELAARHLQDDVLLRRGDEALVRQAWYSGEDSTGEFAAWPKANPDSKVIFWEDVYAIAPAKPIGSWRRVGPLRRTSASLLTWLQNNPNLQISKPVTGKIGKIRARVVDVGVSDQAVNVPGCPSKACANFVQFPQWHEPYGIAGKSISRFYLSDVRYGGQRHLFVAVIEATSRAELNAFLAPARKLIATVRVPTSQG
jgi:hypothetical protein